MFPLLCCGEHMHSAVTTPNAITYVRNRERTTSIVNSKYGNVSAIQVTHFTQWTISCRTRRLKCVLLLFLLLCADSAIVCSLFVVLFVFADVPPPPRDPALRSDGMAIPLS